MPAIHEPEIAELLVSVTGLDSMMQFYAPEALGTAA